MIKEELMKINLYKIQKLVVGGDDVTHTRLVSRLKKKEFYLETSKSIENINYELYLCQKEREKISWLEELKFIFEDQLGTDYGNIYHAILVIHSVNNNIYALSFGRAYNVLQSLCDPHFALDFAERELTTGNIDSKGSDYIQGTKLKELTNVTDENVTTRVGGECFTYVGGKPAFSQFGSRIDCTLSIQFSSEISFESDRDLAKITSRIIEVERSISQPRRNTFPRIRFLAKYNAQVEKLDAMLLEQLKNKMTDYSVYVPTFEIQGSDVLLNTSLNKYELYVKRHIKDTKEMFESFDTTIVSKFIMKHSELINEIDDVQVIIHRPDDREHAVSIKRYLFTIIEDDKKYILTTSKWGVVNQRFLDELERSLDYIQDNHSTLNEDKYSLSYDDENDYINQLLPKGNYVKLHPKMIKVENSKFELADLYDEDSNELFAIKLGSRAQPLVYAFEQNNTAVKCLLNPTEYDLKVQLENHQLKSDEVNNVMNAKTYSVILGLETPTHIKNIESGDFRLTDLRSILLQLKIVSWASFMASTGMNFMLHLIPGKRN